MIVYHFPIPVPAVIERICVWGTLLYRKIRFGYAFRRIKLTQGKYAIVDLEDFEILKQHKWHTRKSGKNAYACRSIKLPTGKRKSISMHRQIINPGELLVDHINRNGLDNRRANLRPATPQQNSWNRITKRGNTGSKYIGVRWNGCHKKWRAGIRHNKKMEYLGYFDIEKDAAKIYDIAAKKYRGDFAILNFNQKTPAGVLAWFRAATVMERSFPTPYTLFPKPYILNFLFAIRTVGFKIHRSLYDPAKVLAGLNRNRRRNEKLCEYH